MVGRTTPDKPYRILCLCTGNSARSIIAECALNRSGAGQFQAFSAGSHPKGEVHPMALRLLRSSTIGPSACAARAGTSSPAPTRHGSISCSRSAIGRPPRSGRASR
jgi:protein-tyrosine-phosphatase